MQEGQEERCWEVASQRCPNQGLIAVLTGQHGWREQREIHVLMGRTERAPCATKPSMGAGDWWDTRLPYP